MSKVNHSRSSKPPNIPMKLILMMIILTITAERAISVPSLPTPRLCGMPIAINLPPGLTMEAVSRTDHEI
jgi:hypothetical protein